MTHKEEVKLNRFLAKEDAMRDIALCMLGDNGRWLVDDNKKVAPRGGSNQPTNKKQIQVMFK